MTRDYKALWDITRGQRLRHAAATFAIGLSTIFLYAPTFVAAAVIDGVLSGEDRPDSRAAALLASLLGGQDRPDSRAAALLASLLGGRNVRPDDLWVAAVVIVAVTALAGVFNYLRGRWTSLAAERIAKQVRDRVYDHLQHLPCAYHDRAETGDLVQRCTSDVETLRVFLADQVVHVGRTVVMVVLVVPIMLWFDVRMTLVALAAFR